MSKATRPVHADPYYGPLIDAYIRSILNSGILLDEDLEYLLDEFSSSHFPERKKYKPPPKLLLGLSSLVVSSLLVRKYSVLVLIPPAIATAVWAGCEVNSLLVGRKQSKLIDQLIGAIKSNHKLNCHIVRYMKVRNEMIGDTTTSISLSSRRIKDFMAKYSEEQMNYFRIMLGHLQSLTFFSDGLAEEFKQMEFLDLTSTDTDNVLDYCRFVYDVNLLLSSELLKYIGITLCSKSSKLTTDSLKVMLNKRLPQIIKLIHQNYTDAKVSFDHLRTSVKEYTEYRQNTRPVNFVSSKLRDALVDAINNLSIILEKSQSILEKMDTEVDENIESSIKDLKAHSLATYESIDLLCRLHGIATHSLNEPSEKLKIPAVVNKTDDEKTATVRYDDTSEPKEEKYELYLEEEYKEPIKDSTGSYGEDKSSSYLALMLRELQTSLKQHQKFIEAKKRRGSDESTDDEVEEKPEVIPRFNLNDTAEDLDSVAPPPQPRLSLLNAEAATVPRAMPRKTKTDKKEESPKLSFNVTPPPPPPPLPSSNLGGGDEKSDSYGNKSMLEKIVALSKQRHLEEEVFIISESESD